ncbi:MAG: hypothetical protein ACYDC6_11250 [Acidobacteriaceae bacterium]
MDAVRSRLIKRFVPIIVFYYVAFPVVEWIFHHHPPRGPLAYLLAIIPALPVLAVIIVVGMYFAEEKDEFKRFLITQSLLWSVGITFAFTTVWGFLELFTHIPHLNAALDFPVFCMAAGISKLMLCRSYR